MGLDLTPTMAPNKILLAVVLGASSTLLGTIPAHGAQSDRRCGDQLIELGSMQAALTQMEVAVTTNHAHQKDLRVEASSLAATIAEQLRGGASELDVEPLVHRREAALDELDGAEALQPALERQLEALLLEVDSAERGYIACVEATID